MLQLGLHEKTDGASGDVQVRQQDAAATPLLQLEAEVAGDRGRPHPSFGSQKADHLTQLGLRLRPESGRLLPVPQHGVAQDARQRAAAQLSFDQVILRSAPYCLVGKKRILETGQYDHREVWSARTEGSQGLQPTPVGKREVQENHVDIALPKPDHAWQQRLYPLHAEPGALSSREHLPYQSGISRIVLNEK